MVASLLEMEVWGGTDADSLKKGIDSIFSGDGRIPLDDYLTKLVGITSDGASVNTGRINGLMTQLAEERPWLIKIHCANHRVELAVKDAFKQSPFQQIDDLYISIFYLLRNSGKIKSEIKEAANALQNPTLYFAEIDRNKVCWTSSKCIPAIIRHMASGNCGI